MMKNVNTMMKRKSILIALIDSTILPSLNFSFEQVITGGAGAGLNNPSKGRKVDYYLDQSKDKIDVDRDNFNISFYNRKQ